MRRFWIGVVILLVTLALGIAVSVVMPRLHHPIRQQLEEAVSAAQREDWARAETLAEDALRRWEPTRDCTRAIPLTVSIYVRLC